MSVIVSSALSHLKELEDAMKLEGSSFKPDDIDNCDKLAEYLQELEFNVKGLHDELETETIKASVFRHKMTFFDYDLKKEIDENVKAARNSNMAVILDLKAKLDQLTTSIEKLHKRDKELSEEISLMEPEKNSLETNHENIIISLNEQMAKKALAQIKLNETRDLLRETNQAILELEEDMITLNEKLVKERAEAREQKIGLEEEKYVTNTKAADQEEFNDIKFREVQASQKKLQESNKAVRVIFRENERLEQVNTELGVEIENGTKQLEREQKELEDLVLEGLRLTTLDAKTQQDYRQNKTDTINKTKETSERTQQEVENLKNLKDLQDLKREELRAIYDKYKDLQKVVDTIKKSIEGMRAEIGKRYQDIAELEAKNQSIYEELSNAQQTHNQVMDSLQREAEECKEQLGHERELRLKKQAERDTKLAEIETFNANLINFQSTVSTYMNNNKSKTTEMNKKETDLTNSINFNQSEKIRLTAELEQATKGFNIMKNDLETQINTLEREMTFYKTENDKFTQEITQLNPGYEELCKFYKETVRDYEETRRTVINLKNRKTNLENTIVKVKEKKVEHDLSRDKLKDELVVKRTESLKKMKEQNEESKKLENLILQTGLKTQTLKFQNDKFIKAIHDFESEYKLVDDLAIEELNSKESLQAEYDKLHRELLRGWKSDEEAKEIFANNDLELINKLDELLNRTEDRESKVGSVATKLNSELEDLSSYLTKMIGVSDVSVNQEKLEEINE